MFKNMLQLFKGLCKPSQLYVSLSLISLALLLVQNIFEPNKLCIGRYSCNLTFSNMFIFAGKVVYMIVWTVILNSLCKSGYEKLSWFLVLVPFVFLFVLLGVIMFVMMTK